MQYGMKLAAAGVLAALAGPTWAGPEPLPGGDLHWECPSEGCSADTLVRFEAVKEVEGKIIPSQLFVVGDGLVLGKTEEGWQSIRGVDDLLLYGRNIEIYAAETDIRRSLNVVGSARWSGSPATVMHHIETISFNGEYGTEDGTVIRNQLDLTTGFTSAESVEWNSNAVLQLHGFNPQLTGSSVGSGATLAVKNFSTWGTSDTPTMTVKLIGNSTLVLGGGAYARYAEQGVDGVKRLKSLITDAAIQGQAERATLVTTSPAIDGLTDGVTIEVGTTGTLRERENASDMSPRVVIGSQGRWILSLTQDEAETVVLAGAETGAAKVEALSGAELLLTGWDGSDFTAQLDESWNGQQIYLANNLFLGSASVSNGTLTLQHRSWGDMRGLAAKEIVDEAEEVFLSQGEGAVTDIGRRYLATVMQRISTVQNELVAANGIDETVFLVGSSGLLTSADRSHRRLHFGLLEHDPEMETSDDDTYWWAQVYGGHGSMDKLRSGSDWGYKEDFYGGTLGADWRFASKWIATAAFSGATSDIDTTGTLRGSDSESASLTMAAAGASLTYLANDRHRLHAAVTYSQTQGEAKKISTGYRMKTEPDLRMLSADLGWSAHYAVADNLQVKPSVSVGMDTGRMRKGDITLTTQDGTNSGVGFVQTTGNRRMWHVKGRLETSGKFSVWRYNVEPGFNAGVTLYAGDTDWRVASRLAEGTAVSTEKFHAVGHWNLSGGLSLRISDVGREPIMEGGIFGFGAKDTGKSRAYAWSLDLSAAAETGPYGTEAATFGVRYRELF